MANFSEAMGIVLSGGKARRKDWNMPSHVEVLQKENMHFVAMVMKNGIVGPYPPSHCDMLALDWDEVK